MDINQAARMIEWLDEERRRDRAYITQLEERLGTQQDVIDNLTKRLGSMESEQTVLQAHLDTSKRTTEGELMEAVRREMRNMIENMEAKRLTAEREAERRSDIAREGVMRPVRELTDRLAKLERSLSDMPGFQIERERASEAISLLQQRIEDLNKKLEEPDRRLAYLEEQRRMDARRISETQSEVPEIQKQVESVRPKITLIEELALRNERKIQEISNSDRDRRDQIQQFLDQQTLVLQQRDQQIEDLVSRFGEQENVMEQNIERFEQWAETYRQMKRIIDDFERIGDRLERRINEVAEMQRLSEERFRQEWNDWRADDQKRWKQFTLSNDEVWRSHDKEFDRFVARIAEIETMFPPIQDSLKRIWQLERARVEMYRDRFQELLLEYDTTSTIPELPQSPTTTGSMPAVRATGTMPAIRTTGSAPNANGEGGNGNGDA